MTGGSASPLTIWAVSDGRVGIEAQVLGLAEAVARERSAEIAVKRIGWKWGLGRLPWWAIPLWALSADRPIAPPWPDIWIGAGRATLPLSARMRRWSGGKTFVVQTQDPRGAVAALDLVVPPAHDGLTGDNVLPIVGAPNRLHAEGFRRDLARFGPRIEALPHPRVAMIVGGKSKTHDLPPRRARAMAAEVARAVRAAGGSLLLSFTRRTPAAARAILTQGLADLPGWIWDGEGENPYFAFLAAADAILVTGDSTNLATDAAATGKPVHVLRMAGGGGKFGRFHLDLQRRGIAQPFEGRFGDWRYPPLDETNRAARELLHRFDARKSA
ncbi:MAG TPA: mitochondrial fission ELM1 family protein [Phenylobacterium sp.]|jgi:mitochondrial fission protein ELM1|uniref:mitochondrial fission ELM1 family protein n=1 Tax=Phenylobacterium sp. TaxID=1871053 RepID=UPI002C3F93EE|nr:mitochondrial fission ELM1 family protein [Phenylobacterium sp.]HXA41131.1 mitochondrial fission ELM1 family protein [Phenylobacterium sp.]